MGASCIFCTPETYTGRVIAESDNFVVIPTKGQIPAGGHLLLFPKEHHDALGAMPHELFDEYLKLKGDVYRKATKLYGPTLAFEHGIIGQTIPHAHLQIVPCWGTDILEDLFDAHKGFRIDSEKDLQAIYETEGSYLYYQRPSDDSGPGEQYAFHERTVVPQYFRLLVADAMGVPERGNWKEWCADPKNEALDTLLMEQTVAAFKLFNHR